ncbi:MAG: DUF4858 domain-containing protein [Tannerella sp.]|jgi:hypothetical protein|nr:DUF4858 domain-containing protein [Tannerella sp.]
MKKRSFIFMLLLIRISVCLCAQEEWTPQDSAWLQRVLSGEEKLQLNEETLKAIQSGTLISTDHPGELRLKPGGGELPILKLFEDVAKRDTDSPSPADLPPFVYLRYLPPLKDSPAKGNTFTAISSRTLAELKALDALTPRRATVNDPSTIRSGVNGSFSAESILRTLFWPDHRARIRNARNADAYKTYNPF